MNIEVVMNVQFYFKLNRRVTQRSVADTPIIITIKIIRASTTKRLIALSSGGKLGENKTSPTPGKLFNQLY